MTAFRLRALGLFASSAALLLTVLIVLQMIFAERQNVAVLAVALLGCLVVIIESRRPRSAPWLGHFFIALLIGSSALLLITSGGRLVGAAIVQPTAVMLCWLALPRRGALFWTLVSTGALIGAAVLADGVSAEALPIATPWLQSAWYRMPILLNLLSAPIVGFFMRHLELVMREREAAFKALEAERDQVATEKSRMEGFANSAAEGFWEADGQSRLTWLSEGFGDRFGMATAGLFGRRFDDLRCTMLHEATGEIAMPMRDVASEKFSDLPLKWRDRDGNLRVALMSGHAIRNRQHAITGYRGSAREVTEAWQLRKRLRNEAHSDALTGLANRRGLAVHLEAAAQFSQGLQLLAFDLDRFKRVNDSHGHAAGDALLAKFGALLTESISAGSFAARIGGDEFVVVTGNASVSKALEIAESIGERFTDLTQSDRRFAGVQLSCGRADFLPGGDAIDSAMRRADVALYAAKKARNRPAPDLESAVAEF